LFDLPFDPEEGSDILLRNIGKLVPDYQASYLRRQYLS
jgi:hypothetical protein